jgi:hypothetical protein
MFSEQTVPEKQNATNFFMGPYNITFLVNNLKKYMGPSRPIEIYGSFRYKFIHSGPSQKLVVKKVLKINIFYSLIFLGRVVIFRRTIGHGIHMIQILVIVSSTCIYGVL